MMRCAIAGLGHVGAAVVRLLHDKSEEIAARAGHEISIVAASARDARKERSCDLAGIDWVPGACDLARRDDVEVVIEVMGSAEGTARAVVETALRNGKHVVTANKALIAAHGRNLALLTEQNKVQLSFEAAVCGGVPILKMLREGLAANRIISVRGILNGTCNYILTRMEQAGIDFATALAEAQAKGYAEANPASDIEGQDTANKLAILSALAFGRAPDLDAVFVEGITSVTSQDLYDARVRGGRIKLLGIAGLTAQGDVVQRVQPVFVPVDSALANVHGVLNGVEITGDVVGDLFIQGAGAGGDATASAVVADLIGIARGSRVPAFGVKADALV